MCGIFGAVNIGGFFPRDNEVSFRRQTDLVWYRGPDGAGYKTFRLKPGTLQDDYFDVFLGHRRLSIIDLSDDGLQPLTDGKGATIIFNGEIFNYVELRRDLEANGLEFRTKTDTEVILKTYYLAGSSQFHRFNGMWAFAVVDEPRRLVILSRDRFSIKPLYYTLSDGRLYFASEIKQLLPFVSARTINREALHTYLRQGLLDYGEGTCFKGILQVKPRHNLIIDLNAQTIRQQEYWQYTASPVRASDAFDKFRETFTDSVRIRLRSDVELGALVSGGLDSSAIAVVANALLGGSLEACAVVSQQLKYSEEAFIDILTTEAKLKTRKFHFGVEHVIDQLATIVYHNDEPVGSFSAIANFMLLRTIKRETNMTVLLSGQGGDECLLGYAKYFYFYLYDCLRRARPDQFLACLFGSLLKRSTIWQFNLGEARRYLPWSSRFSEMSYIRIQGPREPVGLAATIAERQIRDLEKYSVPNLTHYEDRHSMAHSLEIRLPFLDHRLVELVLGMPTEMKIHNGWLKYVLRWSIPQLPDSIRWRTDKQGFLTPEKYWLMNDMVPQIMKTFTAGSTLQKLGIIEDKAFIEYYKNFLSHDSRIWYSDISRVLIAEVWANTFLADSRDHSQAALIEEQPIAGLRIMGSNL